MTNECLSEYRSFFACAIATLSAEYYDLLQIGSNCAVNTLFQLTLADALLDQLCGIDVETETCLTEDQWCEIVEMLQTLLKDPCDCNC